MEPENRHQCMIYDGSPSHKLPLLASIIQRKMSLGYRCLYLNSPPMVAGMGSTLASFGVDVGAELSRKSLILSSDPVSAGAFNVGLMLDQLESTLDEALNDGYQGLWASGDMTWEFGAEKDFSKLREYELKLEQMMGRRKELCGVCQYHHDTLPQEAMRQGLVVHPSIIITDTITRINPHYLKSSWPPDLHTTERMDEMINALRGI